MTKTVLERVGGNNTLEIVKYTREPKQEQSPEMSINQIREEIDKFVELSLNSISDQSIAEFNNLIQSNPKLKAFAYIFKQVILDEIPLSEQSKKELITEDKAAKLKRWRIELIASNIKIDMQDSEFVQYINDYNNNTLGTLTASSKATATLAIKKIESYVSEFLQAPDVALPTNSKPPVNTAVTYNRPQTQYKPSIPQQYTGYIKK
jgi:hypothetical protein